MAKTVAQGLFTDSRIEQAKKLIQEALKEHKSHITGVKAGNPELKESYDALLKRVAEYRGGALFYNYIGSGIGNGPLVELADGSVKYDFITGIGVHYMGHSHEGVIAATIDGAISNTVMNGHLQQNTDSAKVMELFSKAATKKWCPGEECFPHNIRCDGQRKCLQDDSPEALPCFTLLCF